MVDSWDPERDLGAESESDDVELAVAAYRDDGEWQVQDLPDAALADVHAIARELRRYPGEHGALALVAVDEDFFVLVRARGASVGVLLSDASAATDWLLARSVVDHLGVPVEDDDEPSPAGDLALLADLGLDARGMGVLLDDLDLYPDEQLSEIATTLGFGARFDDLAGLSNA